MAPEQIRQANPLALCESAADALKCKSLDLIHRTISDGAIHFTAEIIGEADPLLSMTAVWAAARGGREAIIDKSGPLAKLAAKR